MIDLPPLDVGAVIFVALLVLIVGGMIVGGISSDARERREELELDRAALNGLVRLDPALLEAFGKDAQYRDRDELIVGTRALSRRKIVRLAEVHRTITKRTADDSELREALGRLKEARS